MMATVEVIMLGVGSIETTWPSRICRASPQNPGHAFTTNRVGQPRTLSALKNLEPNAEATRARVDVVEPVDIKVVAAVDGLL